jgi:hypothetical protein
MATTHGIESDVTRPVGQNGIRPRRQIVYTLLKAHRRSSGDHMAYRVASAAGRAETVNGRIELPPPATPTVVAARRAIAASVAASGYERSRRLGVARRV